MVVASQLKNKNVLVTGGAGFIGSHLCEKLVDCGANVFIFDNFSTGKEENLENIKDKVFIHRGFVENYEQYKKASLNCDYVFHQAYPYGAQGRGLSQQYIEDGVLGTFNVLKAAVENKVKIVINVSSVAAYGTIGDGALNESRIGNPFLPYGVTKLSGELYCQAFSRMYGLNTVSLRYFYVFGERYAAFDHSALVKFMECAKKKTPITIFGDGSQIRDYTYISDVIEGTLLALNSPDLNGTVYNIGKGRGNSILELAKKVVSLSGENIDIQFSKGEERYADEYCKIPSGLTKNTKHGWIDERNYVADISKAKKLLKYSPKVNLEEGILKTLRWMRRENL